MKIDIDKLTEEELIDLNHRVVERLRFLEQMPTVTGTLTKYNKKTVTVISDDGHRWNVSPSFLRKAEPKDVTPRKDNIVSLK
jgi:hypothetical protein